MANLHSMLGDRRALQESCSANGIMRPHMTSSISEQIGFAGADRADVHISSSALVRVHIDVARARWCGRAPVLEGHRDGVVVVVLQRSLRPEFRSFLGLPLW